jgi:hypothetical protein
MKKVTIENPYHKHFDHNLSTHQSNRFHQNQNKGNHFYVQNPLPNFLGENSPTNIYNMTAFGGENPPSPSSPPYYVHATQSYRGQTPDNPSPYQQTHYSRNTHKIANIRNTHFHSIGNNHYTPTNNNSSPFSSSGYTLSPTNPDSLRPFTPKQAKQKQGSELPPFWRDILQKWSHVMGSDTGGKTHQTLQEAIYFCHFLSQQCQILKTPDAFTDRLSTLLRSIKITDPHLLTLTSREKANNRHSNKNLQGIIESDIASIFSFLANEIKAYQNTKESELIKEMLLHIFLHHKSVYSIFLLDSAPHINQLKCDILLIMTYRSWTSNRKELTKDIFSHCIEISWLRTKPSLANQILYLYQLNESDEALFRFIEKLSSSDGKFIDIETFELMRNCVFYHLKNDAEPSQIRTKFLIENAIMQKADPFDQTNLIMSIFLDKIIRDQATVYPLNVSSTSFFIEAEKSFYKKDYDMCMRLLQETLNLGCVAQLHHSLWQAEKFAIRIKSAIFLERYLLDYIAKKNQQTPFPLFSLDIQTFPKTGLYESRHQLFILLRNYLYRELRGESVESLLPAYEKTFDFLVAEQEEEDMGKHLLGSSLYSDLSKPTNATASEQSKKKIQLLGRLYQQYISFLLRHGLFEKAKQKISYYLARGINYIDFKIWHAQLQLTLLTEEQGMKCIEEFLEKTPHFGQMLALKASLHLNPHSRFFDLKLAEEAIEKALRFSEQEPNTYALEYKLTLMQEKENPFSFSWAQKKEHILSKMEWWLTKVDHQMPWCLFAHDPYRSLPEAVSAIRESMEQCFLKSCVHLPSSATLAEKEEQYLDGFAITDITWMNLAKKYPHLKDHEKIILLLSRNLP